MADYYNGPSCKDCPYLKEIDTNIHQCNPKQLFEDAIRLLKSGGKKQ